MEEIKVEDINELPLLFEAYTSNSKIEDMIKSYKDKYGFEPNIMYRYKRNKINMIAIEVPNAYAWTR